MIEAEMQQETGCQGTDCCSTTEDGSTMCLIPQQETTATQSRWHKMRAGIMFGIACIASPCCTPLIVPIFMFILAGTPAAIWLGQHIGWIYAGLTALSISSFALGFYWMRPSNGLRRA